MTVFDIAILLGAGFLGGFANAIAGGATLITFPALMAVGLPPIIANATNAPATATANFMAVWAERKMLPPLSLTIAVALLAGLLGGGIGAWLLIVTPEKVFTMIVPVLIGVATLIFAFAAQIRKALVQSIGGNGEWLRAALILPASVYGGYFGAGLGVILMSAITATSAWELRTANAFKNLIAVLCAIFAVSIFAWLGLIRWPEMFVLLIGCSLGGFAGGRALRVIPASRVRVVVIGVGVLMTGIYAWRYWL
jgi:uncharacterized membrane protein YfcA